MKVAVSSTGTELDSPIEPRFGRCAYFITVETDDMNFEVFDNQSIALGGGAGIQSAQFIASKGASAVLTGNCGPNAMQALTAAGVKVVIGQAGTVRQAVERYKKGETQAASEANVGAHYGAGKGGGMGGGMGRGMGRRMQAISPGSTGPAAFSSSKADEIRTLKEQAKDLMGQIQEIERRISSLEEDGQPSLPA
jgi:predicted Fe-Mo cluster-binding NifX family protein